MQSGLSWRMRHMHQLWYGVPERALQRFVKNIDTTIEAEFIEEQIESASNIHKGQPPYLEPFERDLLVTQADQMHDIGRGLSQKNLRSIAATTVHTIGQNLAMTATNDNERKERKQLGLNNTHHVL